MDIRSKLTRWTYQRRVLTLTLPRTSTNPQQDLSASDRRPVVLLHHPSIGAEILSNRCGVIVDATTVRTYRRSTYQPQAPGPNAVEHEMIVSNEAG